MTTDPRENLKPVRLPRLDRTEIRVFFPRTPGEKMAWGGRKHLREQMRAHQQALQTTGIGRYYGNQSDFARLSAAERAAWVEAHKTPGTSPGMPTETSCIGWAMENVAAAYKAAGMEARWAEIEKIVRNNDMRGTVLAAELQKDGWQAFYYNPDTRDTSNRGEHTTSFAQVSAGQPYYGIRVDGMILNYGNGPSPELEKLRQAPFFCGVGFGGNHTFVGQDGRVNEVHWESMPDEKQPSSGHPLRTPQVITETPIDHCRSAELRSGVIMVPPSTWPR